MSQIAKNSTLQQTIQQACDWLLNDPIGGICFLVALLSVLLLSIWRDRSKGSKATKQKNKETTSLQPQPKPIQIDEKERQKSRLLKKIEQDKKSKLSQNRYMKSGLRNPQFLHNKHAFLDLEGLKNSKIAQKTLHQNRQKEANAKKDSRQQKAKDEKSQDTIKQRKQQKVIFETFGPKAEDKVIESNQVNTKMNFNVDKQSIQSIRNGSKKITIETKLQSNQNDKPQLGQLIPNDSNKPSNNPPPKITNLFNSSQPSTFFDKQPLPAISTPANLTTLFGATSLQKINQNQPPTTNLTTNLKNETEKTDKDKKQVPQQSNNVPVLNPPTQPKNHKQQTIPLAPGQPFQRPVDNGRKDRAVNQESNRNVGMRPKQKLNSEQLLQAYINFAQSIKDSIPISIKIQSIMGGARSSPNIILVEAKSLLGSIDKNDDKQITAFALKLFQTIVYNFINNSNIKSGLERIPLRERTKQCEKNAINAYILTLNMYRLMNNGKKIWAIVFGKLLKMLQFLFKRKEDLKDFQQLELIKCNYIKKFKEVHSKYVSRIDFLIYFLMGMAAYDPILVLNQVQVKERQVQTSRAEVQSWGNKWSYSEFWALTHAVLTNQHKSYSKPIFFMNLLYVLYPRIYQNKLNPSIFRQEHDLFMTVIDKAKIYLNGFNKMKQVENLMPQVEREEYEFDGPDFIKSIKILESRIAEKAIEIKMNARDFESKANVFYYFTKEK